MCYTEKAIAAWQHQGTTRHNKAQQNENKATVNPYEHRPAPLTVQAPGTLRTYTPGHHTDPVGSSPESSQPTQPSECRRWAKPRCYTDTTRTSWNPPPARHSTRSAFPLHTLIGSQVVSSPCYLARVSNTDQGRWSFRRQT